MTTAFEHLSVMPSEVLEYLAPCPGGIYLDGTVGAGGHARLVLEASGAGSRLVGLDRDRSALAAAAKNLGDFGEQVILRHSPFSQFEQVLDELGIDRLDGMLLDLGVSSHQIDTPERGFSFRFEGPLDMRMDRETGETAAEVLAQRSTEELTDIFRTYGEERFARRIARRIVSIRDDAPLSTTAQLAELVAAVVPASRDSRRIHPATRVFQALRIYVNGELDQVAEGVTRGIERLRPGGRLVVISFHSLEDRIVKRAFKKAAQGCICPPKLPICQCGRVPAAKILTRKARRPGEEETELNARARSAVLRAIERLT